MSRFAACLAVVCSIAIIACKSDEERGKNSIAPPETEPAPEPAPATGPAKPLPPPPDAAPPPAPEPTTPEQITEARKAAMIAGRDADVVKYCELEKITDKTDAQVLLGCALAACRLGDMDRAHTWSKPLPKVFKDQAIKVCVSNGHPL